MFPLNFLKPSNDKIESLIPRGVCKLTVCTNHWPGESIRVIDELKSIQPFDTKLSQGDNMLRARLNSFKVTLVANKKIEAASHATIRTRREDFFHWNISRIDIKTCKLIESKHRSIQATIQMANCTVPAFTVAAFHVPFE